MNNHKSLIVGISLALGCSTQVFPSLQTNIDTSQIQKTLIVEGAKWKAGDNWVSRLPKKQILRMLGSLDHPLLKDATYSAPSKSFKTLQIPQNFDWRNVNGKSFDSPILNQGNCGSCVAFAAVATLETQMNISGGAEQIFNPRFSTQALFACGGGACDYGWWPSSAARALERKGVPDEACAPYVSGATGQDVTCNSACSDINERSVKTLRTIEPSGGIQDANAVKQALLRGPLMTTLTVYEDFVTYSSGIYRHTTGSYLGGHAVTIVGYNDQERYWIVRNSWGQDWGDRGYIKVSYDDRSGISDDTWGFEVQPIDGFVKIESPLHRDFVSETFPVQALSTVKNLENMKVSLKKVGESRNLLSEACAGNPCLVSMASQNIADGEYEVLVEGSSQGKIFRSQPQRIFLVNKESPMNIAFSGDGVDLSKPVSDRLEFKLKIESGVAPLGRIVFHAKRIDAGFDYEYKKETNMVLKEMSMGWRSTAVANGNYEIWFSGEQRVKGALNQVESQRLKISVNNN